MPNNDTIPDGFREFMEMYTQASRPNALEAIGSSMAGFAAPFLGQTWTNPYARKQQTIDPMMMWMMKQGVTEQSQVEGEKRRAKLAVETAGEKKSEDIKKETLSIDNMVSTLFDTAERLIPAVEDPKKAELLGMKRSLGSASILGIRPQRLFGGSNEDVIAYNETMKAEATPIIRSMGEKGMLTNQDIERALGLFPKNSDSIKLRKTRREELGKFLKAKIEAYYKDTKESPSGQGMYSEGDTVTKNGITYTFNGKEWEY